MASPRDAVPTFHGKVLAPGEALPDKSSTPNTSEVPSQANNPDMNEESQTSALDTLGGSTSADVHKGLGHPGQGQSSAEVRHGGQRAGKKEGHGLAAVSSATTQHAADPRYDETQRGLDKDEAVRGRGDKAAQSAEEDPPETA